ncbi:hypothetical protein E2C01_030917 [Portunus trituberculatus]|uniref:Ig-like domain-containing protein n=1 Tax=Portunus trituberculatus TaxID=210409 RepID=A0A5B7EWN5_PORTR|nr:hypothetical protein [Portunus trituberculatus]
MQVEAGGNVTSATLTLLVDREHNGATLTCTAANPALPGERNLSDSIRLSVYCEYERLAWGWGGEEKGVVSMLCYEGKEGCYVYTVWSWREKMLCTRCVIKEDEWYKKAVLSEKRSLLCHHSAVREEKGTVLTRNGRVL